MEKPGMASSITNQGLWLFRWRSYLPIVIIPLAALAILDGDQIQQSFGETASLIWNRAGIALAFVGLVLRTLIVGFVPHNTSGRNTTSQIAKSLNQTGAYSLVRHPLYVANFVIFTGILMLAQSFWLCLSCSFIYWMYYERIICAEESFLHQKFGETFAAWASRTPAVVPNFRNWARPELSFSFRTVLSREHSTLFLIVSAILAMEFFRAVVIRHPMRELIGYFILFSIGGCIYFILRTMKKRTSWLFVVDR